jgi:Domain of unknown function (DUF3303)
VKGVVTMRFMVMGTWNPEQRNDLYKHRVEKGRMIPDNTKVVGEWLDIGGGRQWVVVETDANVVDCFLWASRYSNLCDYEIVPVVEVQDDKGTKFA